MGPRTQRAHQTSHRTGRRTAALFLEAAIALLLLGLIAGGMMAMIAGTANSVTSHRLVADANLQLRSAAETLRAEAYQPCPDESYAQTLAERHDDVQVTAVEIAELDADGQVRVVACADWDGSDGVQLIHLRRDTASKPLTATVAKAGWEGR